jgi:hypothetical protein
MFHSIVEAIRIDNHVKLEEMKLLSFAYKMVIALRRARWRNLGFSEKCITAEGGNILVKTLKEDRTQIQNELLKICQEFDSIFDGDLIRGVQIDE